MVRSQSSAKTPKEHITLTLFNSEKEDHPLVFSPSCADFKLLQRLETREEQHSLYFSLFKILLASKTISPRYQGTLNKDYLVFFFCIAFDDTLSNSNLIQIRIQTFYRVQYINLEHAESLSRFSSIRTAPQAPPYLKSRIQFDSGSTCSHLSKRLKLVHLYQTQCRKKESLNLLYPRLRK